MSSINKATVTLDQGVKANVSIRDFEFISDEPFDEGGTDMGPMPPELLLASVGTCGVITAKLYAQRKGWNVAHMTVDLEMEKVDAASYPAYSGDAAFVHVIRKQFHIEGDLTDEQRTRLIEIAGKCPVVRILQNPVFFEDSVKSMV
jgi:putative redox protein